MTMPIVAGPPAAPARPEGPGRRPEGPARRPEGRPAHGEGHRSVDPEGRRGARTETRRAGGAEDRRDDAAEAAGAGQHDDFTAMLAALVGDAPAAPAQPAAEAAGQATGEAAKPAALPGIGLAQRLAAAAAAAPELPAADVAGQATEGKNAQVTPAADGQPPPAGFVPVGTPGTDQVDPAAVQAAVEAATAAAGQPTDPAQPATVDPATATQPAAPAHKPAEAGADDPNAGGDQPQGDPGQPAPAPAPVAEAAKPVQLAPVPVTVGPDAASGAIAVSAPAPVTAAAPATPAQAAPAAPPAPPATQVAMHVTPLRRDPDGVHRLTVHMTPEALGPVSLVAEIRDNGIQLQLSTSTDAGRDALRNALGDLRKELEQAGFANTSLDLRQDSPTGQERAFAQQHRPGRDAGPAGNPIAPVQPLIPPRTTHSVSGNQRLDLHV